MSAQQLFIGSYRLHFSTAVLSNMTDIAGIGRLFCIRLLLFIREVWQHSDLIAVVTMEHWFNVSLGTAGFEL